MSPLSYAGMVKIAESKEVLDFEDFVRAKNNFHLRFANGMFKDLYWSQPAFVECLAYCPSFGEVAASLFLRTDYFSHEYTTVLYDAYKMIRPYVKTNWELFI